MPWSPATRACPGKSTQGAQSGPLASPTDRVAPRAEALLVFLAGARDEETGLRAGGVTDLYAERLEERADGISTDILNLSVILLVPPRLGLLLAVLVVAKTEGSVVVPIQSMTGAMTRLAGGDLSTQVTGADRADELGDMAKAIRILKENAMARQVAAEQNRETQMKIASWVEWQEYLAATFEADVRSTLSAVEEQRGAARAISSPMASSASRPDDVTWSIGEVRTASSETGDAGGAVFEGG